MVPTNASPSLRHGLRTSARRFAMLLASGALFLSLHSSAQAQWVQGTNFDDLSFQFPTGHVAIGFPTPLTYAGTPQLYVIGTTELDGPLDMLGKLNLRPVSSVASKMYFYSNNNLNFTTFTNGASTSSIDYIWPNVSVSPTAGQVLSYGTAGQLNWVTPSGGIGGGGTPNYVPRFTPTGVLLGNSVIQDQTSTGTGVIVGPLAGPATTDLLQVEGNTRIGGVYPAPVLGAAAFGTPILLGGVAGNFPPAPNSENTDVLQVVRRNNSYDNSEIDMVLGDNPEGLPDGIGGMTPDKFTIGGTPSFGALTGLYQSGFTFSTASGLALGYGVANLNGLDIGASVPFAGATIAPNANVAIGINYGGLIPAPPNGLIVQGRTGIGTSTPGNNLEVNNALVAPNSLSGVRLTQFAGMTPVAAAAPNGYALSVNPAGDVICTNAAGGGGVGGTGTAKQLAVWTAGSTIGNSILWDNGSKIGLSTTTPSSTLSFQYNGTTTPAAQTIGVERTTVSSAPGTPLSISAGGAISAGSNLAGGDLTLSGGISTGSGASNILFQVASGASGTVDRTPATKMFLAGGGKLGLGTISPTKDLSLDGGAARTVWIERNGSTSGKDLTVQAGGGQSSGTNRTAGNLVLSAGISTGSAATNGAILFQTPTPGTSGASDNAPSTKMWILPTGTVGINVSSPSYTLDVDDGSGTGTINASGTVYAAGLALTSDSRLKKDIVTIPNAIQTVMQLRGVEYNFRDDVAGKHLPTEHQIGVIAQEVQAVLPEAIKTKADGYMAVEYHMITPVLIEAVKDQEHHIASEDSALTAAHLTIVDLTTRLSALESIVATLRSSTGANMLQEEGSAAIGVNFFQNNPNPFKDITTISFFVPQSVTKAELVIVSAGSNSEVMRLPITIRGMGSMEVSAASLNSGQYLYSIMADEQRTQSKKMIVLK